MRLMTDRATAAIDKLHAWHDQQNPLVRALAEPVVQEITEALLSLQAINDEQAAIISALSRQVAEAQANTASLLEAARSLRDEVEARGAQMQAMQVEHNQALQVAKDRIDQLERHVFGRRSERRTKTPDARDEARKRRNKELADEERDRRRHAAAKARQAKLDKLRTVVLDLPLAADVPGGRALPPLESVIYEWRPGELVRVLVRREQRALADGQIVTAPPPPQVIEGGSYGPALHAKVAMDKCLDALPLRRQERIFQRIGAPLPISVLCALYHRCAEQVRPMYEAIQAHVRVAEHVAADETPQPVLDEDKVRKGWMWVFATDEGILYVYSPSRGGGVPAAVLGASKGTLTVDGHTGYNLVTRIDRRERGGCWSHGRRGLYEAGSYAEALVDELLELIGELYFIEHLAMEQQILGTASHLALRQERSAPVVARIYELVETDVERFDARSSLAKAMRYLMNQRAPLSLFLTNALVPIHNNLSERALRVVALQRNNSLFVGSDEGGEHLAMLLTMAATCRMHDVDPEKWLTDVLIRIGERGSTVEELLPWNWKEGRGANFTPVFATG
jgi:transposase